MSEPVALRAQVRVERPGHTLDVALEAHAGEVIAVVGPNGSGKTTLLRALAGLQPLTAGEVVCGGTVLDSGAGRVAVPHRRVGLVPQDLLLFPHLAAVDNVAFGLRARGVRRSAARLTARTWLERLGVGALADRRPHELSGGQAQRVALARTLATEPELLLLDEPFAALDVAVAMGLRVELARHLAGFRGVTLLVTHDALDALSLADRVVVLDSGRVAQEGPTAEVASRPRTPHVARLVGLNVLRGTSRGNVVELADGTSLVTGELHDGPVSVTFAPSAVAVAAETSSGSARNQWPGRVVSVTPHGLAVRVHLDAAGGLLADVTAESAARLGLVPGRTVWAAVKATELVVFGDRPAGEAPLT